MKENTEERDRQSEAERKKGPEVRMGWEWGLGGGVGRDKNMLQEVVGWRMGKGMEVVQQQWDP